MNKKPLNDATNHFLADKGVVKKSQQIRMSAMKNDEFIKVPC